MLNRCGEISLNAGWKPAATAKPIAIAAVTPQAQSQTRLLISGAAMNGIAVAKPNAAGTVNTGCKKRPWIVSAAATSETQKTRAGSAATSTIACHAPPRIGNLMIAASSSKGAAISTGNRK